ncbi:four-carbon acid sugar kinase family protein [Haloplanus pelagicus]|jgi:uncharacterized protein YgbK (DUF1537 family)|uniref:four-carbon acid sugar kinase family protein n=1 Tax=Haloplanus pelagicus TaxID=2949995 RepID=UPI00203FC341|nr:four-carbon acid sugar kinase family protein [Haloplanus sp. HW8-1]
MDGGLIVADDLTGACDTGHEFARRGYRTRVLVDGRSVDRTAADVLVVNTDSRYDSPEAAATAVRTAVESRPDGVVYKKIDSTLRGNLGAEVAAAMGAVADRDPSAADGTGAGNGARRDPLAVVAPASLDTGRMTACGRHLVDGALVTDTEAGADAENGPASAHLPSLFEGIRYPVAHVGIDTVAEGAPALAERFRAFGDGPRIVTVDATHERHLEAAATAARRTERPTVYVGSAGLAKHVEIPVGAPRDPGAACDTAGRRRSGSTGGGVLGVVGSVAPVTLRGIDALPDRTVVAVDPAVAVGAPGTAVDRATERIRTAMDADESAVVTAATDRGAVDRALSAGADVGLSPRATRERIAGVLARTASHVVADRRLAGLFLTGGDTAMAVLDALDARSIDLRGEAVEAGIPVGTIDAGVADGTALITKAGAFGEAESIFSCLNHLRRV